MAKANISAHSKQCAFYVAIGVIISFNAQAEWKGKGELGLVLARGNTNTETVNMKADMTMEADPWKHLLGFAALRSSAEDIETADRYEIHGQSNYKLTKRSYVLGALRYEDDNFSPYDYQAIASVGYGYKIYDTETLKLATEAGIGYRRSEDRLTGETQGDAIFRGQVAYEQMLTSNTKVFDNFLIETGSDNTFLQNELGVKVSMSERLALSVAHVIRRNSAVTPPVRNTDQLITANLVFSY